jgi:hypothetical protein
LALAKPVMFAGDGSVEIQEQATLAQPVEQAPCKRWVVGSNPTGGSKGKYAHVAQSAEHSLGKGEVMGSNPIVGLLRQNSGNE